MSAYAGKHIQLDLQTDTTSDTWLFYFADGQAPEQYYVAEDGLEVTENAAACSIDGILYYCSEDGTVYGHDVVNDDMWWVYSENTVLDAALTKVEWYQSCDCVISGFAADDA